MLAGVKFIPRDRLLQKESDSGLSEEAEKSSRKHKLHGRRKRDKSRRQDSSAEEDDNRGAKRRSGGRRKRRKSRRGDDDSSHTSSESDDSYSSEAGKKRGGQKKRRKSRRSDDLSPASSESEDSYSSENDKKRGGRKRKHGRESKEKRVGDEEQRPTGKCNVDLRKEMGLEWMTSSGTKKDSYIGQVQSDLKPEVEVEEEKPDEQASRSNPRELNPYLKDNGHGYPDDAFASKVGDQPLPSSVVGDGGVSWRLKALKRAKEQAAREGRKLDEVVEERWDSLGQLAASVAARRAAPSRAHLHAIRDRHRGQAEKPDTGESGELKRATKEINSGTRDYLREVSSRHPEMRKPKHDNLSWKKIKGQNISSEDNSLISAAVSGLNKFANDGSFMESIIPQQNIDAGDSSRSPRVSLEGNDCRETELDASAIKNSIEMTTTSKQVLSANQLAAKALQLRMKGKHDEAEKLLREMETMTEKHETETTVARHKTGEITSRCVGRQISTEWKKREEDADFHLAQKIMQNKKYSMSGRADDEYDFDGAASKSRRQRKEGIPDDKVNIPSRFMTQQERCQFCFENPSRPRHLVISIANFTYMMLPQWQPVVQGHCCILPMQHDSATRTVDKNVWEELRNFKKCLLRMFAEQEKGVVFLETVIDLGNQRRHCLIDCIPIPKELSKQAPLYFKKAIDEAEEEWGQHEMKKVIPTSGNLRNVIPENFSYFHVEFGLDRGFAHVIDDDSNFKSSFGLNVIRGMLRLPEEDMHRRRRHEPMEKQQQAVAIFAKDWEPFDWTKELG